MSDLIKREDAIDAIECVTWYHQNRNKDMVSGANSDEHQAWYKAEDIYDALKAIPSAGTDMSEYDAVINAVYTVYSFLKNHEETSGTTFWKSNIDGTILATDWGYFEEGLKQIEMYCERLAEGSRR